MRIIGDGASVLKAGGGGQKQNELINVVCGHLRMCTLIHTMQQDYRVHIRTPSRSYAELTKFVRLAITRMHCDTHCSHTLAQSWALVLSLLHVQVLLGLLQLLFHFRSPEWAARKMEERSLIADHAVFNSSLLTGSILLVFFCETALLVYVCDCRCRWRRLGCSHVRVFNVACAEVRAGRSLMLLDLAAQEGSQGSDDLPCLA